MATYSIAEAIQKMLEASDWKDRYINTKIREDWKILFGITVAKHTHDVIIRERKLYIYTDVAALKNELRITKDSIKRQINEYLKEPYIIDVIIV
jgi:Protein of unknown function (DUF721).